MGKTEKEKIKNDEQTPLELLKERIRQGKVVPIDIAKLKEHCWKEEDPNDEILKMLHGWREEELG